VKPCGTTTASAEVFATAAKFRAVGRTGTAGGWGMVPVPGVATPSLEPPQPVSAEAAPMNDRLANPRPLLSRPRRLRSAERWLMRSLKWGLLEWLVSMSSSCIGRSSVKRAALSIRRVTKP